MGQVSSTGSVTQDSFFEEQLRGSDQIDWQQQVLESLASFKSEMDLLLSEGFFRGLLVLYRDLEQVPGFREWLEKSRLAGDDCPECDRKQLELLRQLTFQLGESQLLGILVRIRDLLSERTFQVTREHQMGASGGGDVL